MSCVQRQAFLSLSLFALADVLYFLHASVVDYEAARVASASAFANKVIEARSWVTKMQKAQRLAEKSLDL